jgi:hypothetical protein
VPGESVDTTAGIRERVDKFAKATTMLDNGAKNVMVALDKLGVMNSTAYKKEFSNLGKKLEEFGLFLSNDALDAPNNSQLSTALITAGNTYNQIGNMYGEQVHRRNFNCLIEFSNFHIGFFLDFVIAYSELL